MCGSKNVSESVNVRKQNQRAWDRASVQDCDSSIPVGPEEIQAARRGEWSVKLTPRKFVPRDWFPVRLAGTNILCLAAGGGQQVPILAAAGAKVTALELSPEQLEKDQAVAAVAKLSSNRAVKLEDEPELEPAEAGRPAPPSAIEWGVRAPGGFFDPRRRSFPLRQMARPAKSRDEPGYGRQPR